MPPGESARSSTETRTHPSSAAATAAAGKGRNDTSFRRPTGSCSSRSSSTTSLTVPAVEPSATIACVASVESILLERVEPSPGQPLEVGPDLLEDVDGSLERCSLLAAQLEVVVGHRKGPLRRRSGRVEHGVRDAVRAHEAGDVAIPKQRDRLGGVRDREAVQADEHRQQDARILGDPRRHHHEVVRLLGVLGEELDDAGIPNEHRVRVVAVDVDRPGERAVAERHHDRRAHRGGDVDDLGHEGEPLGRGRGHRPSSRERGADCGAHGGVLRLDVDDLRARLSVRDELREGLDDRRLRRDRVDGHDVGIDLAHRVRDSLAPGEQPDVGHSVTISIAATGQTSAQIPQPLQ